ncbi:MAG: hypothetical protein ABI333_06080 [bacterium]
MMDDNERGPENDEASRGDAEGDEELDQEDEGPATREEALRMAGQYSTLAGIEERHARAMREAVKHSHADRDDDKDE